MHAMAVILVLNACSVCAQLRQDASPGQLIRQVQPQGPCLSLRGFQQARAHLLLQQALHITPAESPQPQLELEPQLDSRCLLLHWRLHRGQVTSRHAVWRCRLYTGR